MGHTEAPAWWADVQHLRDVCERTDEARRRADLADVAQRRATLERRPPEVVERRATEVVERRASDAGRPAPVARRGPHPKGTALPARRTVEIRGRTVPAPPVPRIELDRRRPTRSAVQRVGPRPDRLAMWALLMGLLLILVAVGTADASVLAH
ncbi:MAG: hypothetical protein QOG42_1980 [Solirubrobacteraceae bacterium]|jgi:hypothetical protein|nr:hypothetical protein [Solirubrobacteraceae bacterium]